MNSKGYLERIIYRKVEIDRWLCGLAFARTKYDSELGYLFRSGHFKHGIDGSSSIYTFEDDDSGPRKVIAYGEKPCRINTYGNSFTLCSQVNDGETWQERLAARFGEPIRNFGIGGHSSFQAYLRMKQQEERRPAEYIIFNIYDDDHYRSLVSWQRIREPESAVHPSEMCPTQPYLEVDFAKSQVKEHENPCPTPESLYDLCDLSKVHQMFKNDFVLRINLAQETSGDKYSEYEPFLRTHGVDVRIRNRKQLLRIANLLYKKAATLSGKYLIGKVQEFAEGHDKEVLFVLTYSSSTIAARARGGKRSDQELIEFLDGRGLPYVDMMDEHIKDYSRYSPDIEIYLKQYYIDLVGHYTPLGNLFLANAIKDKFVQMLEPKPLTYLGYA